MGKNSIPEIESSDSASETVSEIGMWFLSMASVSDLSIQSLE